MTQQHIGRHRSGTPAPQPTTYAFHPLLIVGDDALIAANVYDSDTVHACIRDDSGAVVASLQLSVAAARTMAQQLTIAACKIGVARIEAVGHRIESEHLIATVPGEWPAPWTEPVSAGYQDQGGVA